MSAAISSAVSCVGPTSLANSSATSSCTALQLGDPRVEDGRVGPGLDGGDLFPHRFVGRPDEGEAGRHESRPNLVFWVGVVGEPAALGATAQGPVAAR
jgi:hypothetical protein